MLKTARKRKHVLLSLATFLVTFSILFGRLVVSSPALADENQPEPPDQEPPETSETSDEPGHVEDDGTDEDDKDANDEDDEDANDEDDKDANDEDEDDDGVDDDDEDKLSREVQVVHDDEDNKVKIESELRTGERKDEYKVEIKGEDDLRIKYEYESEAGSEESEIELEIRFKELIEYNDTDGDGFNETNVLATHPLEDFSFTLNPLAVSDTGEKLYEINATSAISEDGGVFRVRVLAPENFTLINGEQTAPTTLKIDIEIHNFPYTDSASLLALKTKVELETSTSIGYMENIDENLEGISTTIGDYAIEFTWVSTATVDGTPNPNTPVGAKIFESEFEYESDDEDAENETELKLYILYPRGTDIIHDPKIGTPLSALPYAQGVEIAAPSAVPETLKDLRPHISIGNLFFGSLVIALLVVAIPVLFRRRKS